MEFLQTLFDSIKNNVELLATLRLTAAISLGIVALLSIILCTVYTRACIKTDNKYLVRILKPLFIMGIYAISFGVFFVFNIAAPWEYSITEILIVAGYAAAAFLLVYFVCYRFIIIPIICLFGMFTHVGKKNKLHKKHIKKSKSKKLNAVGVESNEKDKDIDVIVSEHTRVWLKKLMHETGSNNRVDILRANKKNYIETTTETLSSLCKNPRETAGNYYTKYLDLWK